jgi:hypothetical protein
LPIRRAHVRRLAGGVPLREVLIFGERHPATERDQTTVRIEGGRELFAHREMVPGTVVHLLPGHQGMIELAVHEDEHEVRDVWMLSVDDHGQLHRYRADAVTVRYETDGPLYKAERRWEDHPALHAEAKNSAIELIIDAFERFGADGMSTQEVWDAVALHRLFALSTISTRLSEQKRLFERRGDRWFLTGDKTILQPQGPAPDVPLDRLLRPLERFLATFPEFRYKVAARLGFRLPEGSTDRELVRQHGPAQGER